MEYQWFYTTNPVENLDSRCLHNLLVSASSLVNLMFGSYYELHNLIMGLS